MESFNKFFEDWNLVLFGLLFWGSIFVAALLYIFEAKMIVSLLGYALGLAFGLLAKYRGWSWIN